MRELAKQQANNLWHDIKKSIPHWDRIKDKLIDLVNVLYCRLHKKRDSFKTSLKRIIKVWCDELQHDYYERLKMKRHSGPENEAMISEGSSTTKHHCPEESVSSTSLEILERAHHQEPSGTRKVPVDHASTPKPSLRSPPHCSAGGFFPQRTIATSTPTKSSSPARPAEVTATPDFTPYRSPPKGKYLDLFTANSSCPDLLRDILLKNIESSSYEWEDGYVYIFVRPSSPQCVKIGYTKFSVQDRVKEYVQFCGYNALLKYQTRKIPWAARLEKIVHAHLDHQRQYFNTCKCGKKHHEWFHIEAEEAREIVSRWESWILDKPYIDHQSQENTERLHPNWSDRLSSSYSNSDEDRAPYPWHDAAALLRRDSLFDYLSPPPSPSPSPRDSSGHTRHQYPKGSSVSPQGTRMIEFYFSPTSTSTSTTTVTPASTNPSTPTPLTTLSQPLPQFRGGRRISSSAMSPRRYALNSNNEEDEASSRRGRRASSTHPTQDHDLDHWTPLPSPEKPQSSFFPFPRIPLYIPCLILLFMYVRLSGFLLEWCV
ncbi:MAG: hypothetical protein Q9160_002277 [Pyrenula sp. 1 TL-2023]